MGVLDVLPVPILIRERSGSISLANAEALLALKLSRSELNRTQITRIGESADSGSGLFLLSLDQTLQRRIQAKTARLELLPGSSQEVLVIEPPQRSGSLDARDLLELLDRQSEAVQQAANSLLWDHKNQKRESWNRSARLLKTRVRELRDEIGRLQGEGGQTAPESRLVWVSPRALLSNLLRRTRRHLGPEGPFRLRLDHDLGQTDRILHADPVAVTKVLLTGLDLLSKSASGGTAWIRATETGCRLRLVLDGSELAGAEDPPDLRRRRSTVQELTPILRESEATFEVHRDSQGQRKVLLTLPTHPDRDSNPDCTGTGLPFRQNARL